MPWYVVRWRISSGETPSVRQTTAAIGQPGYHTEEAARYAAKQETIERQASSADNDNPSERRGISIVEAENSDDIRHKVAALLRGRRR